jgi:hypothetical protein
LSRLSCTRAAKLRPRAEKNGPPSPGHSRPSPPSAARWSGFTVTPKLARSTPSWSAAWSIPSTAWSPSTATMTSSGARERPRRAAAPPETAAPATGAPGREPVAPDPAALARGGARAAPWAWRRGSGRRDLRAAGRGGRFAPSWSGRFRVVLQFAPGALLTGPSSVLRRCRRSA